MTISKVVPLLVSALAFLAGASEAEAAVSFCFQHDASYVDSGEERATPCSTTNSCEDIWTTDQPRALRGGLARIRKGGTTRWFYTEDIGASAGCTPSYTPAGGDVGFYTITLYAQGWVDGELVRVSDDAGLVAAASFSTFRSGSGQIVRTISPSGPTFDEFNVYAAAAEAAARIPGDVGFDIRVGPGGCEGNNNGCYSRDERRIYLDTDFGHEVEKFYAAHEMGHAVMLNAVGHDAASNCSFRSAGPSCTSTGSHAMTSMEHSSCALVEGFAHFYSAAVWNERSGGNCWFPYWAPANTPVDCERGSGIFPLRYMENQCTSSFVGKGTELDWMRALWDYYEDPNTAGRPSFPDILDFLSESSGWGNGDAWSLTQDGADAVGTSSRWTTAGTRNGVDH